MLIDEIKRENVNAIKQRDHVKKGIMSIIINKYMILSSDKSHVENKPTDNEVISIIQKTIKELEEEKQGYLSVNNTQKVDDIQYQINIISTFLPKMLTDGEILKIIDSLEDKSLPSVMKYFKIHYAGRVDMKKVSELIKK